MRLKIMATALAASCAFIGSFYASHPMAVAMSADGEARMSAVSLGAAPSASARDGCNSGWTTIPSPRVALDNPVAVDGVSPDDIWAVGDTDPGTGGVRVFAEHWDGMVWRVVPTPTPRISILFD